MYFKLDTAMDPPLNQKDILSIDYTQTVFYSNRIVGPDSRPKISYSLGYINIHYLHKRHYKITSFIMFIIIVSIQNTPKFVTINNLLLILLRSAKGPLLRDLV